MFDVFQEVRAGDLEVYNKFIDNIDINIVNERGGNLLHAAISYRRNDIALDLIRRGIDINHQGVNGATALQYALELKQQDMAVAIIEAGADVNIRDSHGNNALWTAVFNARGNYEMVELILKNGGDAFTKNNAGRSPLDFAVQIGDKDLVSLLESSN
ncbi:MAG: ankyrin repeat domain-containing protein [Acidobacteria bacterium]|nr:ankyrin repeat domain-containing protein [Acidobacteriota bacterium]